MKKLIIVPLILIIFHAFGQNNSFPATGNVGIGVSPLGSRTLSVQSVTNDVNFESILNRTTGTNYAIAGSAIGVGAGLNHGGFFSASGGTGNFGVRIYNVAATSGNYALYSDSPAQTYFQGNVGIGTPTPQTLLNIVGVHGTTKMRLTLPALSNGAGTGEINFQTWVSEPGMTWDGGGIGMNVDNQTLFPRINTTIGQSYIRFLPNTGAMKFVTTNNAGDIFPTLYMAQGNVGVGTESPLTKLDVNGTFKSNKATFIGQNPGANYTDGSIEIREINSVTNTQTSDNYAPRLTFHWGMMFSKSIALGNNGNIKFNNQNATNSFANIEVGNIISSSGYLMRPDNAGIAFSVGNGTNTSYGNFNFNDIAGGTRLMTLLNNGSVGIGTTDPGIFKLAVNGNIKAKEVKVSTQNWADFVFASDYQLPLLANVEAFIKVNKHLPEIPSEKEVKAHGIDLGEMNAKLLQKIEELTLYLIEQNKRMDILQNEVNELKTTIKK